MHLIAYVSESVVPKDKIDGLIADIVQVARRENPKRGITGVLFYVQGKFLQVIEGEELSLRGLMKNIGEDPRHKNVEYLVDSKTEGRGFSDWNMDSFHLDAGQTFDAEILKKLTRAFETSLLPKSDTLVFYYKTLLAQPVRQ